MPKNVRHFMKWRKAIGNTRNAQSLQAIRVLPEKQCSRFYSLPEYRNWQSTKLKSRALFFRQYSYCLQTLGITCIAYSFSPLHEMSDIFRHFMKCLTSRIACNIYTLVTMLNRQVLRLRQVLFLNITVQLIPQHCYLVQLWQPCCARVSHLAFSSDLEETRQCVWSLYLYVRGSRLRNISVLLACSIHFNFHR